MTSQIAADILRDQSAMEAQRYNFDTTNQRIADLILPGSALFTQQTVVQGQRRDQFTFDSTGALALNKFSAAVESILTPRTNRWHGLGPLDDNLTKIPAVRLYCEAWTDILFRARYQPAAGFTYATAETYQSLGAFGNGCIFLDDQIGQNLRYRGLFVGEVWVGCDFSGTIDRVHRKLTLNARQAKAKFGDKVPESIAKAAEKNPEQEFEFIHCVKPRKDGYDPSRRDYRGMKYASYYVATGFNELVSEGGYRTMPYLCSRFSTAPREVYGRGPASILLPTLNTTNEQSKTLLRAGQRAVDPPIMTVDDDALETFNMRSNAINRGFIGPNGEPLAVPFNAGANIPWGMEMIQDSRQIINDGFYVTLFQILAEQPNMTATEALLRAQEKAELLGPSIGRQQAELLDPCIVRELDLLGRVPGLGPQMPPELEEAGGLLAVKYSSPLDRMQRAAEGVGILRWLESVTPLSQVKPEVLDVANWTEMSRGLAEIQGVPEKYMRSEEAVAEAGAAQAEQAQASALLQAAPLAGKAALDIAKAQSLSQAQPTAGLVV